jgi:hypothetical protein
LNPIKEIVCNYWVDLCGSALEKGASMLQKGRFWLFCAMACPEVLEGQRGLKIGTRTHERL